MAARRYGLLIAPGSTRSTGRPKVILRASARSKNGSNGARPLSGVEFHQKVGVAGLWIEIRAARRRAEHVELGHAVASADCRQFLLLVSDSDVHDKPP